MSGVPEELKRTALGFLEAMLQEPDFQEFWTHAMWVFARAVKIAERQDVIDAIQDIEAPATASATRCLNTVKDVLVKRWREVVTEDDQPPPSVQ